MAIRGSVAAVLVGAVILMLAVPFLMAPSAVPPARTGTVETDAGADECIENLVTLEELVATERIEEAAEIVCPASGVNYVIDRTRGRIDCPNPEVHDLSAVGVSVGEALPTVER